MPPYALIEETTFYEQLQMAIGLDLRDARGKKHDLCFVLVLLICALFRRRDGNLSSIHRCMSAMIADVASTLGLATCPDMISRSHLPRILEKVNYEVFGQVVSTVCQFDISDKQHWFCVDGKELRGSIQTGQTRGEAFVHALEHETQSFTPRFFFDGSKESERPAVQTLLRQTNLFGHKLTLDALHLTPDLTRQIQLTGGTFVIGLKKNQEKLLQQMEMFSKQTKPTNVKKYNTKGHGRIEAQGFEYFDISTVRVASRWSNSNFSTLIKVQRNTKRAKTGKTTYTEAYYISNGNVNQENYAKAIRNHWKIEVAHHYRDVSLKEDSLRTKITEISYIMADMRSLVLAMLKSLKPKNMVAQMEYFADHFHALIAWLKTVHFL